MRMDFRTHDPRGRHIPGTRHAIPFERIRRVEAFGACCACHVILLMHSANAVAVLDSADPCAGLARQSRIGGLPVRQDSLPALARAVVG